MTYNQSTHLLRPLIDGEILQDGDIFCSDGDFCETRDVGGQVLNGEGSYFRPVPISTWHPRSESHLIKEAAEGSEVKYVTGDGVSIWRSSDEPSPPGMAAFFIIPPRDVKPEPVDGERGAFERWWQLEGFSVKRRSHDGKGYVDADMDCSWRSWQASAARKEGAV